MTNQAKSGVTPPVSNLHILLVGVFESVTLFGCHDVMAVRGLRIVTISIDDSTDPEDDSPPPAKPALLPRNRAAPG